MDLPVRLRTAEEMYQYSCENGFGTGFGKSWGKKNFSLLEKKLGPDEAVFLTFVGLHRFHSMSAHQRNFAYAITNQRILMGQVRTFGRIRFESVPLNEIMNLSFDFDETNVIGVAKIMLVKDAIAVGMSRECAEALSKKISQLLPLIQELAQGLEDKDAPKQ